MQGGDTSKFGGGHSGGSYTLAPISASIKRLIIAAYVACAVVGGTTASVAFAAEAPTQQQRYASVVEWQRNVAMNAIAALEAEVAMLRAQLAEAQKSERPKVEVQK